MAPLYGGVWNRCARVRAGANDRIRFGLIGAGGRGKEIFQVALHCPNAEAVAVADIYPRCLDEARAIAPAVKTYDDYRRLLDDKSIDAVLIATPQHQHALCFVAAIQAGKDVYQEKTMAFNPGHAKRMRAAFAGSGRVVQVGMQMNSAPSVDKIRELVAAGRSARSRPSRPTITATPPMAAGSGRFPPTVMLSTSTGRPSRAKPGTMPSIPSVT